MAKKSDSPGYRDIASDIRKGNFAPVYLLMGEEDYYIDKLTELLEATVVAEDEKDFNSATFYGADVDVKQVISRAQQFPLMSERQLVMLKEAQALEKAKTQIEGLTPYVNHASPTTVLVITFKGENLNATSKLVKAIKENGGVVFKSERPRDNYLSGYVSDYCADKKVRIDDKSISLLCEYIGTPLSKLFGEIDKLIVAAGKSNAITPDLIEKTIGISKEYNNFELLKKISVKDYPKASQILHHFSRNPKQNPSVVLIAVLFNYFSKLFIASIAKDKSDFGLMKELDLKSSYALTDYRNGLKHFRANTIDTILHEIRNTDLMTKGVGSTADEYDLLKELLFKIFFLP